MSQATTDEQWRAMVQEEIKKYHEEQLRALIREELNIHLAPAHPEIIIRMDQKLEELKRTGLNKTTCDKFIPSDSDPIGCKWCGRPPNMHQKFKPKPSPEPRSGYMGSSNIGGLYILNQWKETGQPGCVWRLHEIHDDGPGPAMVTLENTTTKARITIQQDYWWKAYHYLGHMWQEAHLAINSLYTYDGHKYAIRERSEETASVFLVPVAPANGVSASLWMRIDRLTPPLWKKVA
jgi:hypothetical protein